MMAKVGDGGYHRRPGERSFFLALLYCLLFYCSSLLAGPLPGAAKLNLVFILDGLRPDSINPDDTPNLYRLREEGINFINSHAVFPTVTRVNAASLATGSYPGSHGLVSNSMYIPEITPSEDFSTGDFNNLVQLDEISGGRLLFVQSIGETLAENGALLAAVSSGSTGSAFLLNHRAPQGTGILINGYFDPGVRVGWPDSVNHAILDRFGPAPAKGGDADLFLAPVDWAEEVLREYVLPELAPAVVFNWLTEPDHAQHFYSAGSPEAVRVIRNDDRHIGLILDTLRALGLYDKTNIFVISDHGFSLYTFEVNVEQALIEAGLKERADSDDVVLASSRQTVLIHVKDRNRQHIRALVEFLQQQDWAGALFTAPRVKDRAKIETNDQLRERHAQGWVNGTFSLELIHEYNTERGADIILTFPWTSEKNSFGKEGTDFRNTSGITGPVEGTSSGHGSMSPWTVRNTFIAWGADFKNGIDVRTPVSNADITPTILALLGIDDSVQRDGRILLEALEDGPDHEKTITGSRVYKTETRNYAAAIQISFVEGHAKPYIDKSWRLK